jgi:vacuolar-type H+-ATPase subunit I/STV1
MEERERDRQERMERERKFSDARRKERKEKKFEERFKKLQQDIIKNADIISRQFRGELEQQAQLMNEKICTVDRNVAALQSQTQQQIKNVNERVNDVSRNMNERLGSHVAEVQNVKERLDNLQAQVEAISCPQSTTASTDRSRAEAATSSRHRSRFVSHSGIIKRGQKSKQHGLCSGDTRQV